MYVYICIYLYVYISIYIYIHTYSYSYFKVPHPQRQLNVVLVGNGAGPAALVEHYTKAKSKIASHRTTSFCLISSGADKTGKNSRKSAGDGILKLLDKYLEALALG